MDVSVCRIWFEIFACIAACGTHIFKVRLWLVDQDHVMTFAPEAEESWRSWALRLRERNRTSELERTNDQTRTNQASSTCQIRLFWFFIWILMFFGLYALLYLENFVWHSADFFFFLSLQVGEILYIPKPSTRRNQHCLPVRSDILAERMLELKLTKEL